MVEVAAGERASQPGRYHVVGPEKQHISGINAAQELFLGDGCKAGEVGLLG